MSSKRTARALVSRVIAPLVIAVLVWRVWVSRPDEWIGFKYTALASATSLYAVCVTRGRWRDVAVVLVSLLVGVGAIEAYLVGSRANGIDDHSVGYSVARPILGWGPEHPGVFHHRKLAAATRAPVFDVDYTIDDHLGRRVESADTEPAVAFVGDSLTFGTGLPDAETLPQQFADDYDRKIGVLNLAFPGYGPQQFLRAVETGLFDKLLSGRVRLLVYETAAWHAERASCTAGYMLRAPRYAMVEGAPRFQGTCYKQWVTLPRQLLANTSVYHALFEPAFGGPTRNDMDLYVAIVARAAALARQRYGAPTLVLYVRSPPAYWRRSGYSEEKIMQRLRDAGLEVIDASLYDADHPGVALSIPGDGHPTGAANGFRAAMIKRYIEEAHPHLFKDHTG